MLLASLAQSEQMNAPIGDMPRTARVFSSIGRPQKLQTGVSFCVGLLLLGMVIPFALN
jgi:hypothetical protein